MKLIVISCVVTIIFGLSLIIVEGIPIYDPSTGALYNNITSLDEIPGYNATNGSEKELYVIKAVVYEIGILTEVDGNSTNETDYGGDEETQQVDLSFFNTHVNGSQVDFGDIPLPIQEQINGQIITGIAPVHIGSVGTPQDLLRTLPLTGAILNITDSENAVINYSSHNLSESAKPTIVSNLNFKDIPVLANTVPVLPNDVNKAKIFQPINVVNPDNN